MFLSVTEELLSGLGISVEIFILTLIFSLPLGLIIAFGSMSRFKPLKYLVDVFDIGGTILLII